MAVVNLRNIRDKISSLVVMDRLIRKSCKMFYYWTVLGSTPLNFNRKTCSVTLTTSGFKWILFCSVSFSSVAIAVYQTAMFFAFETSPQNFRPQYFVIHFMGVVFYMLNFLIFIHYYISDPAATVLVLNDMHRFYLKQPVSLQENGEEVAKESVLNLQRFALAAFPIAIPFVVVALIFIVIADCSRTMHVYHIYDSHGNCSASIVNRVVYVFTALCQPFLAYWLVTIALSIYMHLLGIERFVDGLTSILNNLRFIATRPWTSSRWTQEISNMRQLQVALRLFNVANAKPIFYLKEFELWLTILGFFVSFVYMGRDWKVSIFCGILGITAALSYAICYENAYKIPMLTKKWKEQMLLMNSKSDRLRFAELKRQVNAVREEGIRFGSFSFIERTSTPTFLMFCTTQIASLLITFN